MRLSAVFLRSCAVAGALIGAAACASPIAPRERAVAALTEILGSNATTERVHAAEVLIRFGHAREVFTAFQGHLAADAGKPIQRVISWRVLAAAAPTSAEREHYRQRILAITDLPDAPDRIHAIESAAKIGALPSAALAARLQALAATAPERDVVFLRWLLWSASPPSDPAATFDAWLGSSDPVTALRAAYILRWIRPSHPRILAALARAADAATGTDVTSAIILASACQLAPSNDHAARWRQRLGDIAFTSDPSTVYHALQGLMPTATSAEVARYLPLLEHSEADIRVGAAWLILETEARRP